MNKVKIMQIIEGLLFIHGEEGISLNYLQETLKDVSKNEIKEIIEALKNKYSKDDSSAFEIQSYSINKYRLHTKTQLHEYFVKLEDVKNNNGLSKSSIEVLSIIAYKSPITKNEIDSIKDSDCSYQISKLKEKKLIRTIDKTQTGANVYAITEHFFKLFNLKGGIDDLPKINDETLENIKQTVKEKVDNNKLKNEDFFNSNFENNKENV